MKLNEPGALSARHTNDRAVVLVLVPGTTDIGFMWGKRHTLGSISEQAELPDLLRAAADVMEGVRRDPPEGTGQPDPEPRFVIRAQDALSLDAVAAYRQLCISNELPDQANEVHEAWLEIAAWQQRNRDRVKLPDHEHVSALNCPYCQDSGGKACRIHQ